MAKKHVLRPAVNLRPPMMRSVRRSADERHSHSTRVFRAHPPLVVMFKFGMMTWCLTPDGLELFIIRGHSCSLWQYNGYTRETYGESWSWPCQALSNAEVLVTWRLWSCYQ